jgi:hypothetical protein
MLKKAHTLPSHNTFPISITVGVRKGTVLLNYNGPSLRVEPEFVITWARGISVLLQRTFNFLRTEVKQYFNLADFFSAIMRSFCLVYCLSDYSCFTTRGSAVCIAHLYVFLSVLSESALVSIWMRSQHFKQCCVSMTFWCGSGFGSCYFRHRPSRC